MAASATAWGSCSGDDNCGSDPSCCDSDRGYMCFKKDNTYAKCMYYCYYDDPSTFGWDCSRITQPLSTNSPPSAIRCYDDDNCIEHPSCCDADRGYSCKKKDDTYAKCLWWCSPSSQSTLGWDCGTVTVGISQTPVPTPATPIPTPVPTPHPTPKPAAPTPVPTAVPQADRCAAITSSAAYVEVATAEHMSGWTDCNEATLKHVPGEWKAGYACVGPAEIPAGAEFTLTCPGSEMRPCDWMVQHYHCPPCSGETNGGWPGILLSSGWESGSCGSTIANPYPFETVTFRKQLFPGESVTIGPSEKPTRYLSFFYVPGVHCESMPADFCDAAYCRVDAGVCVSNWCPRRLNPKPNPVPCANCLGECS
eukprot:TRINITY_DN147_c1_g4_i1.p1 TRINITY_DN147_c1_g4~~TRINITY_DN147_c1_g4_i1.p1  ORF type:complete len:389 (+),score=95.14 TRINITY_DN147_c1_g4_i1:75-1169(+)